MQRYVISVYVENKYGVVARVSGLFMRRGFNITSFTGQETDDPRFSRLTITLDGDDYTREQLISQLQGTHDAPGSIENYYANAALSGLKMTPAEYITAVEQVTLAQVADAAKALHLHSVFFLRGEA